jgi:tetratricopeptide (TPR) repeat protein
MRRLPLILMPIAVALAGCVDSAQPPEAAPRALPPGAEAISLLGTPLLVAPLRDDQRATLEDELTAARTALEDAPTDRAALIWVGRRTAYLGRYRDAIAVFTDGITRFPGDARFYRHRGHRYITVREFDRAIADLERAATLTAGTPDEVEPDGRPNARNIPTTTLQSNINRARVHRARMPTCRSRWASPRSRSTAAGSLTGRTRSVSGTTTAPMGGRGRSGRC